MADGASKATRRYLDVARLPAEIVELIDALGTDENLVITRAGARIATIEVTRGALEGTIIEPAAPRRDDDTLPPTADGKATVVASALRLSSYVRRLLSAELGEDYVVLGIDTAPPTADVLLVAPVSLQLIGILQAKFPRARVMIVEIEDDALGVNGGQGPVRRLMDAGAETYLISNTITGLATQLEQAITRRPQLADATPGRLEIETSATRPRRGHAELEESATPPDPQQDAAASRRSAIRMRWRRSG